MGETRSARKVFVDKPRGESPLGRHKRRLEDNIKIDLTSNGTMWT
jgi:hypothetical protein